MKPFHRCQSCGIPLLNHKISGTQKDGSPTKDFCIFCFKDGSFIQPNITMEEMIEKCTMLLASKSEISIEQANKIMQTTIPQLKRWQH